MNKQDLCSIHLVFIFMMCLSVIASAIEPDWKLENVNYQADLWHVEYLNSRFLAVGSEGLVLESANGVEWIHRDIAGCLRVEGIAFGNSTYVAVGLYCGGIWWSSDLETWTVEEVTGMLRMRDVEWNGQEFVTVGDGGQIWSSPDGQTWAEEGSPIVNNLRSVVWSDPFMVAVGEDSTVVYRTATSGWSDVVIGTGGAGDIVRVIWGGGRLVAVAANGILRATVPSDWSMVPEPSGMDVLAGLAWTGTHYVIAGATGRIAKSTNAVSWTLAPQTIYQRLKGAASNGESLVVVGFDGTIMTTTDPMMEEWSIRSTTVAEVTGIAFDGTTTCAIENVDSGYHHIISSTGGAHWSRRLGTAGFMVNGLEWTGDRFIGAYANDIYWSFDCENWFSTYIPGGPQLRSATGTDNLLVAVGKEVYYSDGSSWYEATCPVPATVILSEAATNGSVWVAVGDSVVVASFDRASWFEVTPQVSTLPLESIASNGQTFVAVGGSKILFSPDGILWNEVDPGGYPSNLSIVRYLSGKYVAFGYETYWVSTDGQTWIPQLYGLPEHWRFWVYDAVDSNGLMRAGGYGGNLLWAGHIFINGFETGGTGAWSLTVP